MARLYESADLKTSLSCITHSSRIPISSNECYLHLVSELLTVVKLTPEDFVSIVLKISVQCC